MADNTDKGQSIVSGGEDEISLDNILNTGANANRPKVDVKVEDTPPTVNTGEEDASKTDDSKETVKSTLDSEENRAKTVSLIASLNGEDLSEDNKLIKSELLSKYEGTSFDNEGNVLDKDGNIVAKFDDVFKALEDDDVVLDDKGNQVDAEGNIIKSKAELAASNSIVNKLHLDSEYEFLDDNGEIKVYSDDDAGIEDYSNDVSEYKAQMRFESLIHSNPVLVDVAKHLMSGRTIDTYKPDVDYTKIDVKNLSQEQKLAYIKESFNGLEKDRAERLVQLIVDSNTVEEEFKTALKTLEQNDKEAKIQRDIEIAEQEKEQEARVEKHWKTVDEIIKTNKTKLITIPEKDKAAFYNYVSVAVNDKGQSQAMIDASNEALEDRVSLDYLRFKKFNIDELVKQKAGTKNTNKLKELLKRSAALKEVTVTNQGKTKDGDVEISLDAMLGGQ